MTRVWDLTDLEFVTLWNRADGNMVPLPLSYTTDIRTLDALEHAQLRIADRIQQLRREGIGALFEVLTSADILVTVRGYSGVDILDPKAAIRLFGARKGPHGWVVRQKQGETFWHSGGFVATECEAVRLADAIVANLPEMNAGHIPEVVLSNEDTEIDDTDETATDYAYGRSAVLEPIQLGSADTARRFMSMPVTTRGMIEISQMRSAFGPRGRVQRALHWRDVSADGRYVTSADTPNVAHCADKDHLINLINNEIVTMVRSIKDESA